MTKVISVVGGRPNFMKLAAVAPDLNTVARHLILHTGQHYDYYLSQSFFKELSLPTPNQNLNVGSGSHAKQTSKIMVGCEQYFIKEKPDAVLVYGDMNSTLGASLAAAKLRIPIAHVESGLRSYDNSIPEEINRRIVDHVSTLLFAPTRTAQSNLIAENLKEKAILTGDTNYDTFLKIGRRLSEDYYKSLNLKRSAYFLVTIHRPSNTDNRIKLDSILEELINLKESVIFLIHPRTQKMLKKFKLSNKIKNTNIVIKSPTKYVESLSLQKYARAVITDSGGMQKEAYYLKVPCITFRNSTEWPELVSLGWNNLWYPKKIPLETIVNNFQTPQKHLDFFGSGNAGKIIVNKIKTFLK